MPPSDELAERFDQHANMVKTWYPVSQSSTVEWLLGEMVKENTLHMFLLGRVHDAFHVGEDDVSVAVLQSLHEFQVVADLETVDRLLL